MRLQACAQTKWEKSGKCQHASSSRCRSLQTAHRKSQHPQVLERRIAHSHTQEGAIDTASEVQNDFVTPCIDFTLICYAPWFRTGAFNTTRFRTRNMGFIQAEAPCNPYSFYDMWSMLHRECKAGHHSCMLRLLNSNKLIIVFQDIFAVAGCLTIFCSS